MISRFDPLLSDCQPYVPNTVIKGWACDALDIAHRKSFAFFSMGRVVILVAGFSLPSNPMEIWGRDL